MKKQISLLAIIIAFYSCREVVAVPVMPQNSYTTQMGADGTGVVNVMYNGTSMFMDLVLFNSLYSHGGYGSVYGYYGSHPAYFRNNIYSSRYNTYRSYNTNRYRSPLSNQRSGIYPNRTKTTSGVSSYRMPTSSRSSYSSPSRSSSRSYSCPSRRR